MARYGSDSSETIYASGYYGIFGIWFDDYEDYVVGKGGNDKVIGGSRGDTLYGSSGTDSLYGNDGNDYLVGGEGGAEKSSDGGDKLYGHKGNDTLFGQYGNDYMSGGDNDDRIYGGSGRDSMWGSAGTDYLSGGDGDDYMVGGEGGSEKTSDGNDTLYGGNGKDTLYGQYGNDYLSGGADNDRIYTGTGNNKAYGGSGNDYIGASSGNDSLYGDSGNDTISASSGKDYISGSWGNDYIYAGSDDDIAYGGSDNDYITGYTGNDFLYGDGGNDRIYGEWGDDYLNGGYGNDYLSGGDGDDYIAGGSGNDTAYGGNGYDIYTETGAVDLVLNSSTLEVQGVVSDRFYEFEEVILQGSYGNDTFTNASYTGKAVVAYNSKAEDFEVAQNSNGDWIAQDLNSTDGNEGIDTLDGIDQVIFNYDNTRIAGDFLRNTVSAVAGVHNSTVDTSHYISGGNSKATNFIIDIEGTTGFGLDFDTTKLANFINDITLPDQSIEDARLANNLLLDTAGGLAEAIPVYGAIFSTGVAVKQTLDNYAFDLLQVEAQKQAASDAINNPNYNTSAWGTISQTFRDRVVIKDFQIGIDNLFLPSPVGNVGYALKSGSFNGDTGVWIEAQIGNENTNLAFIVNNYGNKSTAEFQTELSNLLRGTGQTTVNPTTGDRTTDFSNPMLTTFNQVPIDVTPSSTQQVLEIGTYASDWIYGQQLANSNYQGTRGSFELIGEFGDDFLQGNRGNDFLWGGFNTLTIPTFTAFSYDDDGYDLLQGGKGRDFLNGGSGNDTIDGGGLVYDSEGEVTGVITNDGTDTLTGGSGSDSFVFNTLLTGTDIITDFEVLIDKILVDKQEFGATSINQFRYNATTGALFFGSKRFAILANLPTGFNLNRDLVLFDDSTNGRYYQGTVNGEALTGSAGNDLLHGLAGDDTLNGNAGSDTMEGGEGNDIYLVDKLGDTVVEEANSGIDLVRSTINFALPDHVEKLSLTGNLDRNGFGNSLANNILGNSGNNYFIGQDGDDTIIGQDGNDFFFGNQGDDLLIGNNGNDILNGSAGNDTIYGNAGNDRLNGQNGEDELTGGGGNDVLMGGAGNDTLTGGIGNDSFRFNSRAEGVDTITDYSVVNDKFVIRATGFGGGLTTGILKANQFTLGASASDAKDRFMYDGMTGALYFDRDGIGSIAQVQIASLSSGLALDHREFVII